MAPPASYFELETPRPAAMVDGRLEISEEDEAEQGIVQRTDEDSADVYTVEDAIEASGKLQLVLAKPITGLRTSELMHGS